MEPMSAAERVAHANGVEDGAMRADLIMRTLQRIARGRPDCGRPYAAEDARQFARETLIKVGLRWPAHIRQKRR